MKKYAQKLHDYIIQNNLAAEQLLFMESCHSVKAAAEAVGALPEDLVKNICFLDKKDNLIVAIVKGEDRVDRTRVGKVLNIPSPRIATEAEILEKSGYPCGGVPSFGFSAIFIIDPKVMEKELVYTGGGSSQALVKIKTSDLLQANKGLVERIRQ